MKKIYKWYEKHVNENDPNTCIIKIKLDKAVVFGDKDKLVIDYVNKVAERYDFYNDIIV